ncbi:MAG: DUF4355 domain-containing protein [Erysipelotrichaceae bacterium]|nr:DUF4355 domain-containing protein [Erysipelotrichaceae bacterium]
MEDDKNLKPIENEDAPEITLDELLKDPKLQAQFDKKAEGMKKKWQEAWQKKSEAEKIEAERLARMTEEEKQADALRKANERADKAEKELNGFKLKDEAIKIAKDKNLDINFLDVLDYGKETAESVKTKIDLISSTVSKVLENKTNELMKQTSPKQVNTNPSSAEKSYLDEKYKNNPYYKG